jgi:hypothetical protein
MILLSAGLKDHESIVRTKSNIEGAISLKVLPDTTCENIAPVIVKKKPAYAHSFNKGNLGISTTTTPNIFQNPRIVRK